MLITHTTIITISAVMAAVITIFSMIFSVYRWYLKQEKQDEAIKEIKKEQRIICAGVMACLDGLQQQGCNHSVPETKDMIEKYLNEQAHK